MSDEVLYGFEQCSDEIGLEDASEVELTALLVPSMTAMRLTSITLRHESVS